LLVRGAFWLAEREMVVLRDLLARVDRAASGQVFAPTVG
jgi:hypothetical protein